MKTPIRAHTITSWTTGCRRIVSSPRVSVYPLIDSRNSCRRRNQNCKGVRGRPAERQPDNIGTCKETGKQHDLNASRCSRAPSAEQRANLGKLVRFRPVTVQHAWPVGSTKNKGVETRSYVFELSNGLCATGLWVKAIDTPEGAPAAIVLNDGGKKSTAADVSDHVNRGEQVLALDLLFTGDNSVGDGRAPQYTQLLATVGDRPIGIKAAQLLAIVSWMERAMGARTKRVLSTGIRSQAVSLITAALDPKAYAEVSVRKGIRSFGWLLDAPVPYEAAPDLFCLDLYKEFDLPSLAALAAPVSIRQSYLPPSGSRPADSAAGN